MCECLWNMSERTSVRCERLLLSRSRPAADKNTLCNRVGATLGDYDSRLTVLVCGSVKLLSYLHPYLEPA